MPSHGRRAAVGGALFALLVALAAAPAAATLTTSIDLNYTYGQERLADEVTPTTQYQQRYEIKYETTLTSSMDFLGALKVDIDDTWKLNEAATSRVSPSLDLQTKGPQASVKLGYSGVVNSTEEFRETGESVTYSNSADLDVELVPAYWPEVKLKLQRRREYQEQREDGTTRLGELQLRDDLFGVRLEFLLKHQEVSDLLPERTTESSSDWSWKASYKELLYGGTEFDLGYELRESYSEVNRRGVFVSENETYTQVLRTRLKKSLDLSPRLNLGLSWEYSFEQDLLQLEFDHNVDNKFQLDVRYDMLPSLKLNATAKRDTSLKVKTVGEGDEHKVTDSVRGAFDFQPTGWLRIGGKAEWRTNGQVDEGRGGAEERDDEANYELNGKAKLGEHLELGLTGTHKVSHLNGWLDSRASKVKADGTFKLGEFSIEGSVDAERTLNWDDRIEEPQTEVGAHNAKIKFSYKFQLSDLLMATFAHEYGVTVDRELDEVLDYTRERSQNESTRFSLALADFIEGLRLTGEIERSGDDTEGDDEPQTVEVAYSLKLDWKYEALSLNASFKYNDKGAEFDDLSFTSMVSWSINDLALSGGYEFSKIYADETDEDRKLNLKLTYKF